MLQVLPGTVNPHKSQDWVNQLLPIMCCQCYIFINSTSTTWFS